MYPSFSKKDGILGPKSKKALQGQRCNNKDIDDKLGHALSGKYTGVVTYTILDAPGYLVLEDVCSTIDAAFREWSHVCGLEFKRLDADDDSSDIKLSFSDSMENIRRFDGPGGVLGRAGYGFVTFDLAERWTCDPKQASDAADPSTWKSGQPTIYLGNVALHGNLFRHV